MPRQTRAAAKKAAAIPIVLSDEEQSSDKPPPSKVRKISSATNTSDGIGNEEDKHRPSASPSKAQQTQEEVDDEFDDFDHYGSDVPLSQAMARELDFLDFSQKRPTGIYATPLSSYTINTSLPPPTQRKRERERSVSPAKAPPQIQSRRNAMEDRSIVSPSKALPATQRIQHLLDDTKAPPQRSQTLTKFLQDEFENSAPKPTLENNAQFPSPPILDAAGFLPKATHVVMDSDDEEDGGVISARRRAGETEQQFKTRMAFENTIKEKNRQFAERRKTEGGGGLEDLLSIIPLEDRVLTSRKKRLIRKKDIDRAMNGEPEEESEDDGEDKEPLDIAAEQRKQLEEAIKRLRMRERERAYRKTVMVDGEKKTIDVCEKAYYIKGMVTPLLPHQIICVDWMVNEREVSRKAPYGGLLGDAMGLGKTMQCIAAMCQNPPPPDFTQNDPHITLIVCPVALIQQWKRELEQHCRMGKFDIHIHHGKDKLKTAAELRKKQVVITTYHTVLHGFPSIYVPDTVHPKERDSYWDKEFRRRRGVLHRVRYWRIIFDECHIIRNKDTKISEAATKLVGEQVWCLSGTPIFNSLWDLYPIFKLIDMPRLSDADGYRSMVNSGANAAKTVQVALRAAMMRRTKEDTFMDKPLIELPPKEVKEVMIEFDPDARALYDIYEGMARVAINDFSKKDTVGKNFSHILVLLLRLRQLCNHPYLTANELKFWGRHEIQRCIDECDLRFEEKFGEEALREFTSIAAQAVQEIESEQTGQTSPPGDKDVKVKSEVVKKEKIKTEQDTLDALLARLGVQLGATRSESSTTSRKSRPVRDLLVRYLDRIDKSQPDGPHDPLGLGETVDSCPICFDQLSNPVITPCQHVFCRDCIESGIDNAANGGLEYGCPVCHNKNIEKDDLKLHGERNTEVSNRALAALGLQDTDKERKKIQLKINKEFQENINKRFFMTRKLEVMRDQLREWRNDRPDDKVVLFSQFTKFLDIVEKVTDDEGWTTTRYQGDMPIAEREKSLVEFRDNPDCWIMLTSTKAGGVGLNLTHANLVISMDLWWNAASELQAFDRVHRLGQRKDVEVKRLIMENSVETRMLVLQQEKLKIAGIALGEGDFKLGKLTTRDLMGLFGAVGHDREGRMMVRPDAMQMRMPGMFPGGLGLGGGRAGDDDDGMGSGEDEDDEEEEDEDEDMDDE